MEQSKIGRTEQNRIKKLRIQKRSGRKRSLFTSEVAGSILSENVFNVPRTSAPLLCEKS